MANDKLWFLLGGVVWGAMMAFTIAWAVEHHPGARPHGSASAVTAPAGPMAPTDVGSAGAAPGGSSAPMMAEIGALKERLGADPQDLQSLVRLGNIYHDVGMWTEAIEYYEQAVAIAPDDPDVITDLGVCYQQAQRFDEALASFARAQQVDPDHWQSLYNTVIVAGFDLGRFDVAEAALAALDRFDPAPQRLDELRAEVERRRSMAGGGP